MVVLGISCFDNILGMVSLSNMRIVYYNTNIMYAGHDTAGMTQQCSVVYMYIVSYMYHLYATCDSVYIDS